MKNVLATRLETVPRTPMSSFAALLRLKSCVVPLLVLLLTAGCAGTTSVPPTSPSSFESMPSGVAAGEQSLASNAPATSGQAAPPAAASQSQVRLGPAAQQASTTISHAAEQGAGSATSEPATHAAPLLIYEASLALAVYEVDKALDRVEALAKDAGGYLVSRDGANIVVRVPARSFESSLQVLLALGDVLQRQVRVEDVTAKVLDVEARLKNAEAVRVRLTELLAGTTKTEEALAVERELARVTEDIERMKGQLKLWRELIAYSTINVRFAAPQAEVLDKRFRLPFPWLDELGLSNLLKL